MAIKLRQNLKNQIFFIFRIPVHSDIKDKEVIMFALNEIKYLDERNFSFRLKLRSI